MKYIYQHAIFPFVLAILIVLTGYVFVVAQHQEGNEELIGLITKNNFFDRVNIDRLTDIEKLEMKSVTNEVNHQTFRAMASLIQNRIGMNVVDASKSVFGKWQTLIVIDTHQQIDGSIILCLKMCRRTQDISQKDREYMSKHKISYASIMTGDSMLAYHYIASNNDDLVLQFAKMVDQIARVMGVD